VAEGIIIVQSATELDINTMTGKLADTETRFRGVAGAEHRKLEWRAMLDFPINALTREARSADLIVVGQSRGLGDVYRSLDSGRAVLLTRLVEFARQPYVCDPEEPAGISRFRQ
jgi:hypothetical protein